jgi:DNA mismatch endonuclease (patch repair protein)
MTDTVTAEVRSRMMAAVRGRDTKPEITVRKALHAMGFRFRVHARIEKARPDLALAKHKAAIFVHGCFWHAHKGCAHARLPKSNVAFWSEKLDRNTARDSRNVEELEAAGWRVAVIWECDLKARPGESISALAGWIRGEA